MDASSGVRAQRTLHRSALVVSMVSLVMWSKSRRLAWYGWSRHSLPPQRRTPDTVVCALREPSTRWAIYLDQLGTHHGQPNIPRNERQRPLAPSTNGSGKSERDDWLYETRITPSTPEHHGRIQHFCRSLSDEGPGSLTPRRLKTYDALAGTSRTRTTIAAVPSVEVSAPASVPAMSNPVA